MTDQNFSKRSGSYKNAAVFLVPIRSRSRTQEVLEALVDMIEAAELKIGDQLPAEIALSKSLGVGRSTIREALNRWQGLGLVKRHRGAGTYLTANITKADGLIPTQTRLEGEGMLRIIDVRRTLENEAVLRATINANSSQKERIQSTYKNLRQVVNSGLPWRTADQDFHSAIYDASGNSLFGQVILSLDEAYHASKYQDSPFDSPQFGLRTIALHKNLCDSIIIGDTEAACRAISQILDHDVDEIKEITGAVK